MKKLILTLSIIVLVIFLSICGNYQTTLAASSYLQTIVLTPGWNIISTPRVVDNHSFSTTQSSDNFDIYLLDPSRASKWATMADANQTEFQPLYGYFINNKTGAAQTLTLNYKPDLNPNERIYERKFNQVGWYSIGSANPTYVKSKCADITDTNNVSKVLNSLDGFYNLFIDFIDHNLGTRGVGVSNNWKTVINTDVNEVEDVRELSGYATYINKPDAIYNGVQNNDLPDEYCDESLGSVTVLKLGNVPKIFVVIGEKDIILERFNVVAGANEGIEINQIVVSNNSAATISDSDISNIRIRKTDGTIVAGPLTLSSGKAIFNLATPISLTKGTPINLEVIADIVDGNTHTIQMEIATGDVTARGKISGTNITSTGFTTGTTITISAGTLTISMSANHPQGANGYFIKTTNPKTLAVFDVKANVEDIILDSVDLIFTNVTDKLTDTNYLSSVGLYDGDSLISNLIAVNNEDPQQFSLDWTIPVDTTKELTVKGITNNLTADDDGDNLTTTFDASTGHGLLSGEAIDNTDDVVTTAIIIYSSGTVTPSADRTKTPYSQGILAPVNNVILGALKIYAQREDFKLTDLIIDVAGGTYTAGSISSLTLYADDGVAQLSNPVATAVVGANEDNVTFSSSDFLTDIVFTKSVYKTILVKAAVGSTADGNATVVLSLLDGATGNLAFVGQDSGITYDWHNDASHAVVNMSFASPYAGGTYAFDKTIAEMKKASTSPSGSVSRGTLATYAIWDVKNLSSDLVAAVISNVTFTSKTGLPSTLTDGVDADGALLFELYDGDGNRLAYGADATDVVTLVKGSGTIKFTDNTNGLLTIQTGETKQLVLRITTTSTTIWPSNTQMQWTVDAVGDAIVETAVNGTAEGFVGFGGTTWSIPATTNIITLP